MFSLLSKFIFYKVIRWKISGEFPASLKKYIIIIAPHTSNWDFVIGVLGRALLPEIKKAKYLGKKELFRPPFGWIFRVLGGYPVDRSKNTNLVNAIVDVFNKKEEFIIALTPEGTRKRVRKLKTGFYFIAQKAKIPIIMVGFDYFKKEIIISDPFYAGNDFEEDIKEILDFYKGIKGKNPQFGLS